MQLVAAQPHDSVVRTATYPLELQGEVIMGDVIVSLSVSLDGFIAGPDDGAEFPLGRGGGRLFEWMTAGPASNEVEARLIPPDASKPVVDSWVADCGAMISGRRTFDIAGGWKDGHPIDVPNFVLTHEAPTDGEWSPRVEFVTDGLDRALDLAQEAAGDRQVSVCGADIAQQLLRAGKLDLIEVSIAPVLLGAGVRLFDHIGPTPIDLEQERVIGSDGVSHLRYRVVRDRHLPSPAPAVADEHR
jgi:dihydrofolate reductase